MNALKIVVLFVAILPALANAQGPGVPIEAGSNPRMDAAILKKADILREAGKLKLNIESARAQLKSPQPGKLVLPPANTGALSGREIAKRAREGHVKFGWYHLCNRKECGKWHLNLAAAYAVAPDTIATCNHCVEPNDDLKEGWLIAVDHAGEVLPVTAVLAKSQGMDGAFLRVEGNALTPLSFNDNVAPGDPAFCYSTPLGQNGYFSEGIVNRFFWRGAPGKAGTENQWRNLRLNVSTDWAPGSSGAAVLDQAGNIIGHVASIHPLREGPPPPDETEDAEGKKKKTQRRDRFDNQTLITLHDATPARAMLALAKPLLEFDPTKAVAKPADPATPQPEKPRPAAGEPGSLRIGDPAPAFDVAKWVQGEEVKKLEKGRVYLVEFWATWCAPCRATIPHLNDLQKRFGEKGLIVIGQNVWEQDTTKVAPFIKEMGDKMSFRVALDRVEGDDPNTGTMAVNWMQSAGQKGIPSAFLVDKEGRIAWIGHPSQLKPALIEDALAGKLDLVKTQAESEAMEKVREAMMRHGATAVRAIQGKKWTDAEAALASFEEALPAAQKHHAAQLRLQLALGKGDSKAANETAAKLGEDSAIIPGQLNNIAWSLITTKGVEPDLTLAEKLARRAVDSADGDSKAGFQDTLARVFFRQGKKDEAIALQETAVAGAGDRNRDSLKKTLEAYRKGELPAE